MGHRILLLFLLLPLRLPGQMPDTAALRADIEHLVDRNRDYVAANQLDSALLMLQAAESLCLPVFGDASSVYAGILDGLGTIHYYQGDFAQVEIEWKRACDLWALTRGRDHLDYANGLSNLGAVYYQQAKYELAEPLFIESLDITRRRTGEDSPDVAAGLNNLAVLSYQMGKLDQAESCFLKARDNMVLNGQTEDPTYASIVNNLARLYKRMGNFTRSDTLYHESLEIRYRTVGRDHPHYAQGLNNLASLYLAQRLFDRAEPLLKEALSIWGKTVGRDHPDYAWGMNNLGTVYQETGDLVRADSCFREALGIWEHTVGKGHPDYFTGLNNLALLNFLAGNLVDAERLFLEALDGKATVSTESVPYAGTLFNLANVYLATGRPELATPAIREYDRIEMQLLVNATHHLAETELGFFIRQFEANQGVLFAMAAADPALVGDAYDNALFHKGFLLNARQEVDRLALTRPEGREMLLQLKGLHRLLAAELAKPPANRSGVEDLQEQATALEKELTRSLAGYGDVIRQVRWGEVRDVLQPGEAAVEIVRYPEAKRPPTGRFFYAALVLKPGTDPVFVPLFEEATVTPLLGRRDARRNEYVNALYGFQDRGLQPEGEPRPSLYDLIWRPLEGVLEGVHTLYYAPAGLLHRLNVDALPVDDEQVVADRYDIIHLGSTRQLVIPANRDLTGTEACLFGGIRFDLPEAGMPEHPEDPGMLAARSDSGEGLADSGSRGGSWRYLKWTKREVETLEGVLASAGFRTQILTEDSATEDRFKALGTNGPSPRVLHLATHGYFFDEPTTEGARMPGSRPDQPVFRTSPNPMMRSGVILAGGNAAWTAGAPVSGREDGVLTAYEISQMDLSGTELVVLSACETGLGDIDGNEGVYGLQRAFRVAGVRAMIMSLWEVPDVQTQELMTGFYTYWLRDHLALEDAFRKAQKELRETYLNPYYWAGFVLVE